MKRIQAIRRNPTINNLPSKTDQSFKDDCDVNIILRRFMKTGDQSIFRQGGSYSDVSELPDLLEAHLNLQKAKTAFDQLPALVRKKLGNSPLALESYLADPANHEEALELGLLQSIKKTEAHPPNENQNPPQKKSKTTNENKKSEEHNTPSESKSE